MVNLMESLLFLSLSHDTVRLECRPAVALTLSRETYGLRRSEAGCLIAHPLADQATHHARSEADHLGTLYSVPTHHGCELFLLRTADGVQVNGRRPLAVGRIQPGDLLAAEGHTWMVTLLWRPEPMEVPAELADKCCPVCGGQLALAPVVRHLCGRFYHFERPDRPAETDALNCYLAAGTCGGCESPLGLEPQMMPAHAASMIVDVDANELTV